MTNGEKLVKVFPDIELYKKMHGGIQIDFDSVWWNTEYIEPTTKNDLGVDAVSRKAVITIIQNHWWNCRDIDKLVNELPSVTPQEPQSFEWCETCKEYDQDKHCCHRWSKVIRDTVEEMKQEYIEREVLDKLRAEIEAKCCITVGRENDGAITLHDVFEIIDKYKAEIEPHESEDSQ